VVIVEGEPVSVPVSAKLEVVLVFCAKEDDVEAAGCVEAVLPTGGAMSVLALEEVVSEEEAAAIPEVRACSEVYAVTSTHLTDPPTDAGRAMILLRTEESLKATVLEVEGHQHGSGVVTVLPGSSQATHWFEVPLQYTKPAHSFSGSRQQLELQLLVRVLSYAKSLLCRDKSNQRNSHRYIQQDK
jgi:hypothetical protein